MKRTAISAIALALCAPVVIGCFAACGNSGDSSKTETTAASTAPATTAPATTAPAAAEAASASGLIGTWDSQEAEGTSYTFKEDGTGTLNGVGYSTPFTYVDKGDTVEITYDGMTAAQVSEYTIKDDILTLDQKEEEGTDVDYPALTYKKSDGSAKSGETSATPQPDSALLGSWKSNTEEAVFTFNADGTGNLKASASEMTFTFTDDGSTVVINFATADPQSASYKVEGNTLTMTDADGVSQLFTKQ